MDLFEAVRSRADQFRARLVELGADPLRPVKVVEKAIEHLGLELAWIPLGSPTLKGAQAVYDRQTGTICVAQQGTSAERLLTVAHEIGHVYLHEGPAHCATTDVDPTRSSEAAPIGLQRVEDYGAHERRELQANVFARGLLFSRPLARQLHLDDKRTASDIAQALDLPIDLVRQQILDAVLIPEATPPQDEDSPATHRDPRRDASQDTAAAHRDSAFLLQAGPGTGKTRTLVKRILGLLDEGVDAASILVLTFSNRAAGELVDRITALAPQHAARIWIGTFHSFGLDLLRRFHDKLDLPADPELFDASDAIEVLEEILPTLPLVYYRNLWDPAVVLHEIVRAISRAKDEVKDPFAYRDLAQTMLDTAPDDATRERAKKAGEVAQVYALYERALKERRAVDFGDLIMRSTLLLENDATVRDVTRLRHRHILVDEYQDVNHASARLLRALAGDGRRLWVVGDPRQSIYRFRGASSRNVTRFSKEYPDVATSRLDLNYRSSTEVINLFTQFSNGMDASRGMLPLALKSDRGTSGITPQIRRFDTQDDEIDGLAASVRELEGAGVPLRDQAVLCRGNARLNEIATGLEARGVPVLHLGSLFERDEVRDLLALMSLAVDALGDGLVRVATLEPYTMSLADVQIACRLLRQGTGAAIHRLAATADDPALSAQSADALRRLARDLDGLDERSTPWHFLTTWLLDRTRQVALLAQRPTIAGRLRGVAVWQFLNFARTQSPVTTWPPIRRLLDRVRQLVLLAEERDLRQVPGSAAHMDAVKLLTVHGSKGLEFEAVHVPSMMTTGFPLSWRGVRCPPPDGLIETDEGVGGEEEMKRAHEREEECLFFVASSRAKTHLRLTLPRAVGEGTKRTESQYLPRLAGTVTEISNPPRLGLPANAPRPQSIQVEWPPEWKTTQQHLTSYESCPRRCFYTHVLALASARTRTAFTRTHDCLYHLLKWLIAERSKGAVSEAEASKEFDRIWAERGPLTHGFVDDYRRLANQIVSTLVRLQADRKFRAAEAIALDLPSGRVWVTPDEMAELPDGTVVFRRIRTGHRRKKEYEELDYTLYHLAARSKFGAAYRFEALHLADDLIEPVEEMTPRQLSNRQAKSAGFLKNVRAGWFPPNVDAFRCPRCPHFFICDALPRGPLKPTV